jgi:hypothetical protein
MITGVVSHREEMIQCIQTNKLVTMRFFSMYIAADHCVLLLVVSGGASGFKKRPCPKQQVENRMQHHYKNSGQCQGLIMICAPF